ncbi:hypothetical protein QFC19_004047 [Naganishia cerealis]|uniref:Uncharacterized protein n=1 Tax=Naganishia cerealis TaxID=610337 RepID=A0ACC2VXN2_9TREE|nr:hypothetical protein QFC19_004047 [Naganishia cerealis]
MAQSYKLAKSYVGQGFADEFGKFLYQGRPNRFSVVAAIVLAVELTNYALVSYVSRADATNKGMLSYNGSSFTMGVDAAGAVSARGRDSVRISSKDRFNDGIYILDLAHMPVGCGTWPAYWTTTEHGWPAGGEIDILEGANALPVINSTAWTATTNLKSPSLNTLPPNADTSSLHTSSGCFLSASNQSGTIKTTACDAKIDNNIGCGIEYSNATSPSLGLQFNQQNGGWYVMWRDVQGSGGIYIWFWGRNDAGVPQEIKDGSFSGDVSATSWGVPSANFSIPDCKKDFNDHVIVFNIALCGDYTAASYTATGCPGSCPSFVMSNPLAFADAYFTMNSLRVFTSDGKIASKAGSDGLSTGALAGIVVGAVVGAIILIAGLVWYLRRKRRDAATARTLAPGAMNNASMSSVTSATDTDKDEGAYRMPVLLPGETPTTRAKAPGRKVPPASSAAPATQGSKASSSRKGYAPAATSDGRSPSRAQPPTFVAKPQKPQNKSTASANPAFAFSKDPTKDKFRPGWAV